MLTPAASRPGFQRYAIPKCSLNASGLAGMKPAQEQTARRNVRPKNGGQGDFYESIMLARPAERRLTRWATGRRH
jgi:hypothetical protein